MASLSLVLQKPLSEKEADCVLELRDANRDGALDKKELMYDLRHKNKRPSTVAQKMHVSREQMKEIFREHDIDGDGLLNIRELTKAFSFLGSIFPFYKAQYGLAHADNDGNALISETELDKLIDYVEKINKKNFN